MRALVLYIARFALTCCAQETFHWLWMFRMAQQKGVCWCLEFLCRYHELMYTFFFYPLESCDCFSELGWNGIALLFVYFSDLACVCVFLRGICKKRVIFFILFTCLHLSLRLLRWRRMWHIIEHKLSKLLFFLFTVGKQVTFRFSSWYFPGRFNMLAWCLTYFALRFLAVCARVIQSAVRMVLVKERLF